MLKGSFGQEPPELSNCPWLIIRSKVRFVNINLVLYHNKHLILYPLDCILVPWPVGPWRFGGSAKRIEIQGGRDGSQEANPEISRGSGGSSVPRFSPEPPAARGGAPPTRFVAAGRWTGSKAIGAPGSAGSGAHEPGGERARQDPLGRLGRLGRRRRRGDLPLATAEQGPGRRSPASREAEGRLRERRTSAARRLRGRRANGTSLEKLRPDRRSDSRSSTGR